MSTYPLYIKRLCCIERHNLLTTFCQVMLLAVIFPIDIESDLHEPYPRNNPGDTQAYAWTKPEDQNKGNAWLKPVCE